MPSNSVAGGSPWTILSTLQWTTVYLKSKGLESARIDAETLLAHNLDCERIDLYLRHDQPLNEGELNRFKTFIKRRLAREPVAYITGLKEFWSLPFEVSPAVLIPRPETECVVEAALKQLSNPAACVLELGVGSGAISVALAHERPGWEFIDLDRSVEAIQIARKNAQRHGRDDAMRFLAGDWIEALSSERDCFDLIVSNPPYIRSGDMDTLAPEVRLHEPSGALDGGPDGLLHIRKIITSTHPILKPNGLLILEIGFDQRTAVKEIAAPGGFYESVMFEKDYSGHDRVALLRKKGR